MEITEETTREEMVRAIETLERTLENRVSDMEDRHKRYNETIEKERNRTRRTEMVLAKERAHLKDALAKVYDGEPSFAIDSPEILQILGKAFRIGHLIGYRSEVYSLAQNLGLEDFAEKFSHIDRQYDEAERESHIESTSQQRTDIHPLDPRAQAVWERCAREATSLGLCSEYEHIAERLGVPTDFEVAYSGYVDISYSGYSRVYVEGTASRIDLANGDVSYADDFDIRDYINDIEWEVDETDVSVDE
jgi:hypothetical protein